MTETADAMLILSDQAGNYYLLPRETVERARVPEEQNAAIERALAREDVAGFGVIMEERPAPLTVGVLSGLAVRGFVIYGQPSASDGGAAKGMVVD